MYRAIKTGFAVGEQTTHILNPVFVIVQDMK